MRNYLFLRKMKDLGCLKIISFLSINRKDRKIKKEPFPNLQ